MSKRLAVVLIALAVASASARAQAVVGQPAPAFTATDATGHERSLAEYKGRVVVLEWWNPECPFVGKHYGSGNMQRLQKEWTARGVVWLAVDSSAPGQQGFVDGARATALMRERQGAATAVLLDPAGVVGRSYGAKTTPHMFVIDASGTLVYAGGIDDRPSTDIADVATAKNFVAAALAEVTAGRKVTVAASQPYGCGVKYAR
jgi:peroxiredoxin